LGYLVDGVDDSELSINKKMVISGIAVIVVALVFVTFVINNMGNISSSSDDKELAHEEKWGIYALDLETQETELVYSSENKISKIRLDNSGSQLVFAQEFGNSNECVTEGSPVNLCQEICAIDVDGENYRRITDNNLWDLIPCWTDDDSKIFFLSYRETLDIFMMDVDGGNRVFFYDSGGHDSDMYYSKGKIVFTRDSQIWIINEDGTGLTQVTDPPRAGEWGNAVLPFGDYDPNLSPDGSRIVFERMVDDETTHGIYEIYIINIDGSNETALTNTRYTQGIATWSHSDEKIVYMVSGIGNEGYYDLYMMNSDGSEQSNITPDYFPTEFLCYHPIFSKDDSKVFFVGEWYSD
jgi:Tol biopolymer transport system component